VELVDLEAHEAEHILDSPGTRPDDGPDVVEHVELD
jgi:hypothetical protein